RTAAPSQNRLFCLYRTVPHVNPTGARGAQWRDLDACGWWQEISPFRSQAPSSRDDRLCLSVPVEMTGVRMAGWCRYRAALRRRALRALAQDGQLFESPARLRE